MTVLGPSCAESVRSHTDSAWGVVGEPRTGIIYTPTLELGPKNPTRGGLLGHNSILVVYVAPLGMRPCRVLRAALMGFRVSGALRGSRGCSVCMGFMII